MKNLYFLFLNKKTKIIIASLLGIFLICFLASLILSWNNNLSLRKEFGPFFYFYHSFFTNTIGYNGEYLEEIDYANAHVHILFQSVGVLAIVCLLSILNIFVKNLDKDGFIRGVLLLGNAIFMIHINIVFFASIEYSLFDIFVGFHFLFLGVFYLFFFILNKIYDLSHFLVYLINFGSFYTIYYLASLIAPSGFTGFYIECLYYYFIWPPMLIVMYIVSSIGTSGPTHYLVSANMFAFILTCFVFLVLSIAFLIRNAVIKKRKNQIR